MVSIQLCNYINSDVMDESWLEMSPYLRYSDLVVRSACDPGVSEDIAVIPGLHNHVVASVGPTQYGGDTSVSGDPELVTLALGPA